VKKHDVWLHLGLLPAALLWLVPLWFMLVFATQPENAIYQSGGAWWPGLELGHNVARLEADIHIYRALINSLAISTLSTLLSLLCTSMAGYALARFEFRGGTAFFSLVMGTLAIPYFVVVIPQYILIAAHLQLSNTWWGVLLPGLANSLGIFFMRQNFLSLPQALLDAARIDGAGEMRIFFRIALPLVRPSLAALSLILFLGVWNDYLWPLLVLTDGDMATAPVALGSLSGLTRVSWAGIMAGSLLTTLPLLVAFVLLQKQFLAGITAGGVKD
jgi:lactose/L-arabinose transport system permease protein